MLGAAVFTYGMLTSFVLSGAERNRRAQRPHSRGLQYTGWVLCGFSGATSIALLASAAAGHLGLI